MRVLLFVLMLFLIFSCKKKDSENEPTPKYNFHLKHNGFADGTEFDLDTAISDEFYKSGYYDDFLYREVAMKFWVAGPNLPDTNSIDTTWAMNLSLIIQYSMNEITQNGELPALTSAKLAQAINSTNYFWNDESEMKEVYFTYRIDGYEWGYAGGADFVLINPVINAVPNGGSIDITGTIDSISIDLVDGKVATNLNFEYTIPVP